MPEGKTLTVRFCCHLIAEGDVADESVTDCVLKGGPLQSCGRRRMSWRITYSQVLYTRVRKTSLAHWHCQPESFCAYGRFLRMSTKLAQNQVKTKYKSEKFLDSLEGFWKVWKVSRQSGNMLDSLESFRTVWKGFGQSARFPTKLESFWTAWKVSGQSGRFTTTLEMSEVYYNMNKITELSYQQKLPTETTYLSQKRLLALMSRKRFMHFWHICRRNDLRASSGKFCV